MLRSAQGLQWALADVKFLPYSSHVHFFHLCYVLHGNRQPSTACLIPYGYHRASFRRGQQSLSLGKKTHPFYKLELLPLCYNERGYTFRGGHPCSRAGFFVSIVMG